MTQVAVEKDSYLANFRRFEKQLNGDGRPWLDELRKSGIARFNQVGFPARKAEHWRHTNFQPITTTPFELAEPARGPQVDAIVQEHTFGNDAACELVFINGVFSPGASRLGWLPSGVIVRSLQQSLLSDSALIERHLGRYADIDKSPFTALNTGFIRDGAFIHLQRGQSIIGPVHILFISTGGSAPTVSHPRLLLVAEENTQASLVTTFVGDGGVHFTNTVIEMSLAADSRIDFNNLQQGGPKAYAVLSLDARVGRNSQFVSHAATIGGLLTRNDLNVTMAGERADATVNGLVVLAGDQHCDNHTLLEHAQPNCPSHELYKHVLDDKSSAVFRGKILVRPDAQKTDSKQTSKSLLLSNDAEMNSQPALEIYADDVKCTHGSTIGPVDEEQVFYLRSRGVGLAAARDLMTYAFAADVTRRIKVEPVRRRIETFLASRHGLPLDLRIADLGSHDEAALNI